MSTSKNLKAVSGESKGQGQDKQDKKELSKTVKLGILDRIVLAQLIPQEGHYLDLLTSERVSKKIEITREELKEYNIRPTPDGRGVSMDPEKVNKEEANVEYKFHEEEIAIIKKTLKKMEEDGKLRRDMLTLYREFVA